MNERQLQAVRALRDDEAALRAAAGRLRDPAVSGRWAGLDDPVVAELMAELLELFAAELGAADPPVRQLVVRIAREILGARMDQPAVRRTRRR